MQVRVRAAREDELAQLGRLTVEAYAADGHITADDPYAEDLADTTVRRREAVLLVAEDGDGHLLGTATVVPPGSPLAEMCRPGEVELRMLAVDPLARGRGVGEQLVRASVDLAGERGCDRLVLSSGTWMATAHRLYGRLGFVRAPERDWSPREGVLLLGYELPMR